MRRKIIESYRADKIKIGALVRWSEFPDQLYFVRELSISFCGNPNCTRLEAKLRLVTIKDEKPSIIKMMYKKTVPTSLSVSSVKIIRDKNGNPIYEWLQ